MKHEMIIKREDGSQIKIEIELELRLNDIYNLTVSLKEKGKRKWIDYLHTIIPTFGSKLFYQNGNIREKARLEEYLKIVSKEEILKAKMELWQKIEPVL